jgi:hypothetical protein
MAHKGGIRRERSKGLTRKGEEDTTHHFSFRKSLLMESWTATKKSFKLVSQCHQLLSGFLANDYFAPSVTSVVPVS